MLVQLPSVESGMMKVVSSTIINAIPSMPRLKRTPHVGIQAMSIDACQPFSAGLYDHHKPSETMNSRTKNQNATCRAAGLSTPFAPSAVSRVGSNNTAIAPTTGITSSTGRTQLLYPMESRKAVIIGSTKSEGAKKQKYSDDETPGIYAGISRL